jgi:hypothetical protein
MPRELILAPDAIAALVVRVAVEPYLRRFESDLNVRINLNVHQWTNDEQSEVEPRRSLPLSVESACRLLFRRNHGGDIYNFTAHVLCPETIAPGTGCTGFHVSGWVRHLETPPVVEVRGWTVLYNQPAFETTF